MSSIAFSEYNPIGSNYNICNQNLSYDNYYSGYNKANKQSNYIKRLNEDVSTTQNYCSYNNSKPRISLIDRIRRCKTRERNMQVKFCDGGFRCPKVVRPISSLISWPVQSFNKRRIQDVISTKSDLLLDNFVNSKTPPLERRRNVSNGYRTMKVNKEKVISVKIIVEHEGSLKTKSIKELLKDYPKKARGKEKS